jgi:hypothetical protein
MAHFIRRFALTGRKLDRVDFAMTIYPTDEQAQELFNSIRQEIHHTQPDGTDVVIGYEPVSPGKFLRAGIALFAAKPAISPQPTQRQILQLADEFFPDGVPWQIVPLVQRAFELWAAPLQISPTGAIVDPSGGCPSESVSHENLMNAQNECSTLEQQR